MKRPKHLGELVCRRPSCGHRWIKRVAGRPAACPKCNDRHWDQVRGERGGK